MQNELIISSDENLRSKSIDLLIKKMEQIFGNDNGYDPCPLLSAIELHLNSCLDNNVRSDLVSKTNNASLNHQLTALNFGAK